MNLRRPSTVLAIGLAIGLAAGYVLRSARCACHDGGIS